MTELRGRRVVLRPAGLDDLDAIVAIRSTPEVRSRWRGDDLRAEFLDDIAAPDLHLFTVVDADGTIVGAIQWAAEEDPDYRHANMDMYLHPAVHGRGYGPDAVRTLARQLFEAEGHHRLTIDPAADNAAAIRCYGKVGFRPVGVLRQYERGLDGSWHDGLLMELLAGEIIESSQDQSSDGQISDGQIS